MRNTQNLGWLTSFAGLLPISAFVVAFATSTTTVAEEHPAQQLITQAVEGVLSVLEEGSIDPAMLGSTVEEFIVPSLDFTTMTKLAVSKHWRKASEDQKVQLVSEFKTFLLNTYTVALQEYSGQTMIFKPYKSGKREDRAVVRSVFKQSGNEVPVVYKLHNKKVDWMVYDIEVSNLSLVVQYKNSFSSEIEKNGIVGLINLLKEKNNS